MRRQIVMVAKFLEMNKLFWQRQPFPLSNDGLPFFVSECESQTYHFFFFRFFLPYLLRFSWGPEILLPWQREVTTSFLYKNWWKKFTKIEQIHDMNTSETDRHEVTGPLTKEAYAVFIFITVANVITCPLTTLLNVLIIISVKTKVFLRTKSNIALACLAVTDAVMGLIGQPVFISLVITHLQGDDALNLKQAVVNVFILRLLTTSSLFHLAMITVERYIAIKHSLRYTTIVTEVRLICSSAFLWIIAFLLTLPVILQNSNMIRKISSVTMASCLAIIAFCQVVLYREARRHQRQTIEQQISMEVKQRKLKEKKALKTTTIVLFFLLLNYSPLLFVQILFNIYIIESDNSRVILTLTAIFSVIANSLVNPIIYCVRVRQFRVAFIELIFRKSHAQAEHELNSG